MSKQLLSDSGKQWVDSRASYEDKQIIGKLQKDLTWYSNLNKNNKVNNSNYESPENSNNLIRSSQNRPCSTGSCNKPNACNYFSPKPTIYGFIQQSKIARSQSANPTQRIAIIKNKLPFGQTVDMMGKNFTDCEKDSIKRERFVASFKKTGSYIDNSDASCERGNKSTVFNLFSKSTETPPLGYTHSTFCTPSKSEPTRCAIRRGYVYVPGITNPNINKEISENGRLDLVKERRFARKIPITTMSETPMYTQAQLSQTSFIPSIDRSALTVHRREWSTTSNINDFGPISHKAFKGTEPLCRTYATAPHGTKNVFLLSYNKMTPYDSNEYDIVLRNDSGVKPNDLDEKNAFTLRSIGIDVDLNETTTNKENIKSENENKIEASYLPKKNVAQMERKDLINTLTGRIQKNSGFDKSDILNSSFTRNFPLSKTADCLYPRHTKKYTAEELNSCANTAQPIRYDTATTMRSSYRSEGMESAESIGAADRAEAADRCRRERTKPSPVPVMVPYPYETETHSMSKRLVENEVKDREKDTEILREKIKNDDAAVLFCIKSENNPNGVDKQNVDKWIDSLCREKLMEIAVAAKSIRMNEIDLKNTKELHLKTHTI